MSYHDRRFLVCIGIDDLGETMTHAVIQRAYPAPLAPPWPGGAVVALERERAGADLVGAIDRYHRKIDRGDEWDRDAAFLFDCSSYAHGRALVDAWNRSRVKKLGTPADFLAVTMEETRTRIRGIGRVPWQQLLEAVSLLRRQDKLKVAALPLAGELEQQMAAARQRPLRADADAYVGTDLFRTIALAAFRAIVDAGSVGRVIPVRWTSTDSAA